MLTKTINPESERVANAWATLQHHSDNGAALESDPLRLAFADPEFLLRRETRGLRMQLELMKPDLEMQDRGIENTIVVFGSARFQSSDDAKALLDKAATSGDADLLARARRGVRMAHYYEQARAFGRLVAQYSNPKPTEDKLFVITGGGPGIMGAANRGAHEAGGASVDLSITLPMEQGSNRYITPELSFKFHYFAIRKMHFMMRAKALVAFPGGFGTLDELFEVITLIQTRKADPVPIVLVGKNFWHNLVNFDFLVEEGVISADDLNLFRVVDEPEEAWKSIVEFYSL